MKTSESEIKLRRKLFMETQKQYNNLNQEVHDLLEKGMIEDKSYSNEIQMILESPEMKTLEGELLSGPIYDVSLEDMENPRYTDIHEIHPLTIPEVKDAWEKKDKWEGVYFPESDLHGNILGISFDYSKYYYKVISEDNEITYINLTTQYEPD